MPMVGLTGIEFGVIGIGAQGTVTYAHTIDCPDSFIVSEIAMTSMASTDYVGGDPGQVSVDYCGYGIQQIETSYVATTIFPLGEWPCLDGRPNVTSVTFFLTAGGSVTSKARAIISFWE